MELIFSFDTHGLSCKKSEGHYHHHSVVNEIIHRVLVAAHVHHSRSPWGCVTQMKATLWRLHSPLEVCQLLPALICFAPSYITIAAQQAITVAEQVNARNRGSIATLTRATFPLQWQLSLIYGTPYP